MTLATLARVARIRRMADSARRSRERAARQGDPERLSRRALPLRQWIPVASPHLSDPDHLAPLITELERVASGESIEVCVSVPPRHGKTTTITHWIVWLLEQRPDMRVLYCSFGARMAIKQTRAMRTLARKRGIPLGEVQTASEWTTAGGGCVKACGITGPPTGDGFDVIVVDDPHRSRKSAESPLERDTVNTGYRDDIYTRQLPRGTSHVIVHTRWHEDDLIGVMTRASEDGPRPFRLINLPAIDAKGLPLAPKLWPLDRLQRIEMRLGAYAWASLYQGSPRPKGGALFGPAIWASDPPLEASYAGGVDLARTAKSRSDHQAAVMLAKDTTNGVIYVVDIEWARELLSDRITEGGDSQLGFSRRLHSMQRRWHNASFRWYTGGGESSLSDLLARHDTYPAHIRQVKATEDKWGRAQPFAAAWNAGKIRVIRSLRHAEDLVGQLQRFTGLDGDSDDLVDAVVAAYDEIGGETIIRGISKPEERAALKPAAASRSVSKGRMHT